MGAGTPIRRNGVLVGVAGVDVFLANISHDLRTPLAAIRTIATDLRDGVEYDAETRTELLTTVCDEVDRLDRLVANLLSAAELTKADATAAGDLAKQLDQAVMDNAVYLPVQFDIMASPGGHHDDAAGLPAVRLGAHDLHPAGLEVEDQPLALQPVHPQDAVYLRALDRQGGRLHPPAVARPHPSASASPGAVTGTTLTHPAPSVNPAPSNQFEPSAFPFQLVIVTQRVTFVFGG